MWLLCNKRLQTQWLQMTTILLWPMVLQVRTLGRAWLGDASVPCTSMGFTPLYAAGGWRGLESMADSLAYLVTSRGWLEG